MPNFAKRHYEQIALALQEAKQGTNSAEAAAAIDRCVSEIARVLAADNPKFNRERFIRACQPGANVRARKAA